MVNVGIAGIGFMGMVHYLTYQKVEGVRVAALCEQDTKRLAGDWRTAQGQFRASGTNDGPVGHPTYSQLEQLLKDPARSDRHLPSALAARRHHGQDIPAGKHVFCEKPMALNVADTHRMVEAAQRAGKLLMIGHVLPLFPEYDFAYKTITSGQYGKLHRRPF